MTDMETDQIPTIVLRGLEGNPRTELTPLQMILSPHTDTMITLWWCTWIGTLVFLFVRYIALPLYHKWLDS